jgi:hypothetical protein
MMVTNDDPHRDQYISIPQVSDDWAKAIATAGGLAPPGTDVPFPVPSLPEPPTKDPFAPAQATPPQDIPLTPSLPDLPPDIRTYG